MKKIALLPLFALLVFMPAAQASLLFDLTLDGCTGNCGPQASFGAIALTQTNSTTVTVLETLLDGTAFISTGAGESLEFNITGNPVITIGSLTSGFVRGPN